MAYQSNLLGDFWRSYRQKRIGTGQPLSKNEMGGLLGPMLEYDARKASEAGERARVQGNSDRDFALREKTQKDQSTASMVSGVGQLAQLPMAYESAKKIWPGGNGLSSQDLMARSLETQAANDALRNATSTTAQGSVNLLGSNTAQGAAAGATEAASMAAYDASMAEGAAAGVGSSATPAATGGLTGSAGGNALAGAVVGAGAQYLTTQTEPGRTSNKDVANLSRDWLGMTDLTDEEYASKGSSVAGGATAGGPYGAAASGIIWDIGYLFKTGKVSNELLGIPFADKLF
jgi:hypothetical protein